MSRDNYSSQLAGWLKEMGYTHCFFLAGGNIMHFLDAARETFTCMPVVHEVTAGIAAEYFNAVSESGRAFALVTAGPGVSNILTAVAGAYTEGRELLILGGQVKSSDLAKGEVRQRGIQEVDGVALMHPITKAAVRAEEPLSRDELADLVDLSSAGRPGPVFIELCLDAQGAAALPESDAEKRTRDQEVPPTVSNNDLGDVTAMLKVAQRPLLLLGGGVTHSAAIRMNEALIAAGIPVATTYNGSDRFDSRDSRYFGRPNTWGMRWANLLIQQADLVIAVGTRLGLQQTGFNWKEFGPLAKVVQVDIDEDELRKGHPLVDLPVLGDAADFLFRLLKSLEMDPVPTSTRQAWMQWIEFGSELRRMLPLNDKANSVHPGYWNPYEFVEQLSDLATAEDVVVPCSSGGAFTATYQALLPKLGQRILSNKSLASMGYGLAGAIGAALAAPSSRIIHIEGDGGFAQNLQDLGTVKLRDLNVKTFLWINEGYASIRMTQRNYFRGAWIGCDRDSGVGLPHWPEIFGAFDIPCRTLDPRERLEHQLLTDIDAPGPQAFLVPIHPEQTYLPKISSRITASGSMESNPLHFMSPDLPTEIGELALRYLGDE